MVSRGGSWVIPGHGSNIGGPGVLMWGWGGYHRELGDQTWGEVGGPKGVQKPPIPTPLLNPLPLTVIPPCSISGGGCMNTYFASSVRILIALTVI